MKDDKLSIGQMAKLNHISPSTLRFYEKLGLLRPAYINPETGYRYYDVTQSVVLRAIQYCTNLDVGIKELQVMLQSNDFRLVQDLYRKKLQETEAELVQLTRKEQALARTLEWLEHYRNLPPAGTLTLEYLPTYYVYARKARKNYIQEGFPAYVYSILDMMEQLERDRIASSFQYFTSFTLKREAYLAGDFWADQEGVYVDAAYAGHPHVLKEEGRLCACAYVSGFPKLPEALRALQTFCREHHCTETDDVVCRLLGSLSTTDFQSPHPFLRLQVPVRMEQKMMESQPENTQNGDFDRTK